MALYTEQHIKEQRDRLYRVEDYSLGTLFIAEALTDFIHQNQFQDILDYGAGLGRAANFLELEHSVQYFPYDPAIEEFSKLPSPKSLTIAINSLEYCEEIFIPNIITELANATSKSTFISVNTRMLGGMPRTINRDNSWWITKLCKAFELVYFRKVGDGFITIAEPIHLRQAKPNKEEEAPSVDVIKDAIY